MLASSRGPAGLTRPVVLGSSEMRAVEAAVETLPDKVTIRELDNPLMDALINRYRSMSGGRPIEKRDFASQSLRALQRGEAVGILMDQNMLESEGIFVDFFGRAASTTPGPARLAQKTGVPIVLGLVIYDREADKYRLRFQPVPWIRTSDPKEEIRANTQNFTRLIEEAVRLHPDHW